MSRRSRLALALQISAVLLVVVPAVRPSRAQESAVEARYDARLRVPRCLGARSVCDSAGLLTGRDNIPGGAEPNQPNTRGSCPDGSAGAFHQQPSIDSIRVVSSDGGPLEPGKQVQVTVTFWVGSRSMIVDVFTLSARSGFVTWQQSAYGWQTPFFQNTLATFTFGYPLPSTPLQGIRARVREADSPNWDFSACVVAPTTDHDDLVFRVRHEPFTDDTPTPGTTPVRSIHIRELRNRIDDLREMFGHPRKSWTDPDLAAGQVARAIHVLEMRTALADVYLTASRTLPHYSTNVESGVSTIQAADIMDLRAAVRGLE